jgi:hypothetical protein
MRHRLPGRLVGLAASFAVDADRCIRGLEVPIHRGGHEQLKDAGPACQGSNAEIEEPRAKKRPALTKEAGRVESAGKLNLRRVHRGYWFFWLAGAEGVEDAPLAGAAAEGGGF